MRCPKCKTGLLIFDEHYFNGGKSTFFRCINCGEIYFTKEEIESRYYFEVAKKLNEKHSGEFDNDSFHTHILSSRISDRTQGWGNDRSK
jgi:hypothetical protein